MNYHNITHDDMLNGDGLRIVLWVAGCNHRCPGCQNPQTWQADSGISFDQDALNEVLRYLQADYCAGLTLSGGDPLLPENREDVAKLCRICKALEPTKPIWCYTGYLWDEVKTLPMLRNIDVLVDGPYQQQLRDTQAHWVGSRNQRIIDVRKSLQSGTVVLYEDI